MKRSRRAFDFGLRPTLPVLCLRTFVMALAKVKPLSIKFSPEDLLNLGSVEVARLLQWRSMVRHANGKKEKIAASAGVHTRTTDEVGEALLRLVDVPLLLKFNQPFYGDEDLSPLLRQIHRRALGHDILDDWFSAEASQ